MADLNITYTVRRGRREAGQAIEILALAPSGRILGSVELLVPLMPGFSLGERVGQAEEDSIVDAAKDLARRVAEAVETRVSGNGR